VNNAPPVPVAPPKPDYSDHDVHAYTDAQLGLPHNAPPMAHQVTNHPMPVMMEQPGPSPVAVKMEPGLAVKPDPIIKQEPGVQQPTSIPPSYAQGQIRGPNVAAQRAMQTLGSQFGQKAAGSINAIHSGITQQAAQFVPAPGGVPQGMQTGGHANAAINAQQYRQQMLQQQRAAQQLNAVPNGVAKSQVDGVADGEDEEMEGLLLRRGATGETTELGRVAIDNLLHEQIAQNAKRIEGGGLMLPLHKATKHKSSRSRKMKTDEMPQHDGPDDDTLLKDEDEDDADAINSDLDDPEDNMDDDDDDDDALGQIMLCTWDKVQRVKNKWSVVSVLL
jgi:transcription initiation factor TFIIA large subunit